MRKLVISKEELEKFYIIKKLSLSKIAKIYNCWPQTIHKKMKKYGIKMRSSAKARQGSKRNKKLDFLSKNKLFALYHIEGLNLAEIGQIYNCNYETIRLKMKEYNIKRRGNIEIFTGKIHSEKSKFRMREARKIALKKGCHRIKPSQLEKKLIRLIKEYGLPFKYTGNFSFWIEGVNPDFININHQKIAIEVMGCYWHGCQIHYPKHNQSRIKHDRKRQNIYQKYGWQVIEIWEHEFSEEDWEQNMLSKIMGE